MPILHFDATVALQEVRHYKQLCLQKKFRVSRLDRYRAELVALRRAGASYRELALWLRKHKRLKCSFSTIMRYLKRLPELNPLEQT
ncbi:MAG: hypothetical protein QM752_07120 [Gammaproteobacteria bacterium]